MNKAFLAFPFLQLHLLRQCVYANQTIINTLKRQFRAEVFLFVTLRGLSYIESPVIAYDQKAQPVWVFFRLQSAKECTPQVRRVFKSVQIHTINHNKQKLFLNITNDISIQIKAISKNSRADAHPNAVYFNLLQYWPIIHTLFWLVVRVSLTFFSIKT